MEIFVTLEWERTSYDAERSARRRLNQNLGFLFNSYHRQKADRSGRLKTFQKQKLIKDEYLHSKKKKLLQKRQDIKAGNLTGKNLSKRQEEEFTDGNINS